MRLIAIFSKRMHGGPMDPVESAVLEAGRGLAGSADQGGRRQLTLISDERWRELMVEVGAALGFSARRANLVVSGIDLQDSRGRLLRIANCRLRIGGETRPCQLMEEAAPGLQAAMRNRWGGGAFAEVIEGGPVSVGDTVTWDD